MSKGFNPGQARDEDGRWTTSGGFAKKAKSSLNGKDARKMTGHEKVLAAEIMFGSGSKQHLKAKEAWARGRRSRSAAKREAAAQAPRTIQLGRISRTGVSATGLPGTRSITMNGKTYYNK